MTDYKLKKVIRNGEEYSFGTQERYVDVLIVGGGGGGGASGHLSGRPSNQYYGGGGGGGAGGVIHRENLYIGGINNTNVVIGEGGCGGNTACTCCQCRRCSWYPSQGALSNGGDSSAFGLVAYGGGGGGAGVYMGMCPGIGGSSGGVGSNGCMGYDTCCQPPNVCGLGQGNSGGQNGRQYSNSPAFPGSGGGATQAGRTVSFCGIPPIGGMGYLTNISGVSCYYAGGGGSCTGDGGNGGGGRGCGCPATYYGGGGGGGIICNTGASGGAGCQGIVIIRYKTDGSCGINCATGGTCYTFGGYTIHCFTSNGTFCIVS